MAYKEKGETGLLAFNGIVNEDILREWRGKEAYKRATEMRLNSPVCGSILFYFEQALRKVSWNFSVHDQKKDDPAIDPRVEFLEYARASMSQSWNDFIIEALSMLPYGFALFWENLRRDERNQIVWDSFSPRGQDTVYQWIFNTPGSEHYDAKKRNGEVLGFVQIAAPHYKNETLWMDNLLHFRTRVERGNPEGRSLFRTAWIPYYYIKHLQQIEAIGVERDLAGLPVITLPPGADISDNTTSDFGKAQQIVRNVRNDEQAGIVLPSPDWTFVLASTGGSRAFDTDTIIKRYESRVFMSLLLQFIMLAQDGAGSYALSKDSTSISEMIVNAVADIIAETFTQQAVGRLLRLNGYDPKGIILEHTPAGDTDVVQLADMLQKVGAYVTWDGADELWLRQTLGMPERSVEDLQTARDEKDAVKAEAAKAFADRVGGGKPESKDEGKGVMPMEKEKDMDKEKPMDKAEHTAVSIYAADPPDKRKREKWEREWDKAVRALFEQQKRRVLREARKMKGG